MNIKRKTLKTESTPRSLHWKNDNLIDWINGGNKFDLHGNISHSNRGYPYKFDSAIQSQNGMYVVLYEKTGTKGIILKNGEIIREISRSYYQAHVYEYPICFLKLENDDYGLIHCPNEYNLIEIEHIETGQKIISEESRNPDDCFHSRFRVNPSNTKLINSGWVWHPYGILQIYDLNKGIQNSSIFDKSVNEIPINSEISSAEFLNDDLIFISSTFEESLDIEEESEKHLLNPGEIGLYSVSKNTFLKKIKMNQELGNLIPLNKDHVFDLYEYPKLINMNTGKIILKFEDIYSGEQTSSIIWDSKIPPIAIDKESKRIAIGGETKIELLTYE